MTPPEARRRIFALLLELSIHLISTILPDRHARLLAASLHLRLQTLHRLISPLPYLLPAPVCSLLISLHEGPR